MIFKRVSFCMILLVGFSLIAESSFAKSELKTYPFGIVLRPSLIQKIFDDINRRQEGIEFSACIESADLLVSGKAFLNLENPQWLSSNAEVLALGGRVKSFRTQLSVYNKCEKPKNVSDKFEMAKIGLEIRTPVDLRFFISLDELSQPQVGIDSTRQAVVIDKMSQENLARALHLKIKAGRDLTKEIEEKLANGGLDDGSEISEINKTLEDLKLTRLLLESVIDPIESVLSNWLRNRLRSLTYLDYVSSVFKNSDIWKEGSELEAGALSLANPGDRLRQSEIAFGFFPRKDLYLRVGQGAAELYFNSLFINQDEMKSLVRTESANSSELLAMTRSFMLEDKERSESPFLKPLLKNVDADVTLILPETLINGALAEIYQNDLKQFSTEIDFGKQAAGLITKEALPVSLKIQLESPEVPKILFESNRLNLNVSNYFLSIGTWIEDRLIPSTQVEAKVNISAGLDVSGSTVNLLVQPETFEIDLSQGRKFKNRFSRKDLDLIQSVSNDIWKEFFKRYPKLPLFYTIFKREDSEVKIVNLEVMNEMILLHFDFEEISVDL